MTLPVRRLAAATATLAAVLTALPQLPGVAAVQADTLDGAPAVGACYDVSRRTAYEADTLEVATVSCTEKHTLWVAGVIAIPADVPLDSEDADFNRAVNRGCFAATKKALGDNGLKYARSAYGTFTFHATDAQQALGAHWASCTVGAHGSARTLQRTTKREPAQVTARLPRSLQLCGTARYERVSCSKPHVYRATYATWVKGEISQAAGQRAADRICPRRVSGRTWMWATRPGKGRFSLTCLTR